MANTIKLSAFMTKQNVDDLVKRKLILPGSKTFAKVMRALKK